MAIKKFRLLLFLLFILIASNACAEDKNSIQQKKFIQIYDLYKQKNYSELLNQINSDEEKIQALADYYVYFKGRAYQEMNDTEKALKLFDDIIKKYTSSVLTPSATFQSGKILYNSGRIKEASVMLKKAASPTNFFEDKGERLLKYAQSLEESKQFSEASLIYNEIRLGYPRTNYAREASDKIDNLRKKKFIKPVEADPESLWDEAEILLKTGKYTEAQKTFELLYKKFPSFSLAEKGNIRNAMIYKTLNDDKNYQKKLEWIISHSRKKEIIAEALYLLAKKAWNKHRLEDAKEYIVRLIDEYENTSYADKAYYVLGRIYEEEGDLSAASECYMELAKYYPESSFRNEALFRKGFVLYKLKKYEDAIEAFNPLLKDENSYRDAALYWQAKSYLKFENTKEAAKKLNEIIMEGTPTYYRFIAKQLLKNYKNSIFTPLFNSQTGYEKIHNPKPSIEQALKYLTSPGILNQNEAYHLDKYILLKKIGIKELAVIELRELKRIARIIPGINSSLAILFYTEGDYYSAISLVRRGLTESSSDNGLKAEMIFISYPFPFENQLNALCENYSVNPLIVTSLILQESIFNSEIVSRAGAVGLMQIMPDTGRILSSKLKINDFNVNKLYEPELNLKMGIFYFSDLLKLYNNDVTKALSAYNAGEKAVDRWMKRFPNKEQDEFVEDIPYRETRNYVKLVLRNFEIYNDIYKQ